MAVLNPGAGASAIRCKVCDARAHFFGDTTVLKKYKVHYFRCELCGFIQTEEPYWLGEAYSTAIARQDVGIMHRNLANCEVTSAVLTLLFPQVSQALDFGGGHGVFVRLMRDRGFNFFWADPHASNDYARGFEYKPGARVDFITAFEVLEHLPDPISGFREIMSLSDNVFVSTCLIPEPPPRLNEWWYYVPTTGQHISFYTKESLCRIAARYNRHVISAGAYHLFAKEPKSHLLLRIATRLRMARFLNSLKRRNSLIESDFQEMIGRDESLPLPYSE